MQIETLELLCDIKADNEYRLEVNKKHPILMLELMRLDFPFTCNDSSVVQMSLNLWLDTVSFKYLEELLNG